jgi:hypothetical protein
MHVPKRVLLRANIDELRMQLRTGVVPPPLELAGPRESPALACGKRFHRQAQRRAVLV